MPKPEPSTSFAHAMQAQLRLRNALRQCGFVDQDFPRMVADVDPLDAPRIAVGPISTDTADRLAALLERHEVRRADTKLELAP